MVLMGIRPILQTFYGVLYIVIGFDGVQQFINPQYKR